MTRSQKHFGELKRIHLIGIGGSGMIGLAMVLQKKGFNISGSDLQMTEELSSLKALGAKVRTGSRLRPGSTRASFSVRR